VNDVLRERLKEMASTIASAQSFVSIRNDIWKLHSEHQSITLYYATTRGQPILLREKVNNTNDRWSEHGLGHLLNPIDPEGDDRDWIAQVWLSLVRRDKVSLEVFPEFQSRPAVGGTTISSPAVMRPLAQLNKGKR